MFFLTFLSLFELLLFHKNKNRSKPATDHICLLCELCTIFYNLLMFIQMTLVYGFSSQVKKFKNTSFKIQAFG